MVGGNTSVNVPVETKETEAIMLLFYIKMVENVHSLKQDIHFNRKYIRNSIDSFLKDTIDISVDLPCLRGHSAFDNISQPNFAVFRV